MTGFVSKRAMADSRFEGTPTLKSNAMASTVSHAENCLYDILQEIEKEGTPAQREAMEKSLESLETLYFLLREDD